MSAILASVIISRQMAKPTLGFPANMQPMFPAIHNGGTTVNGIHAEPSSFVMLRGDTPY